jgi:hypothetical protein
VIASLAASAALVENFTTFDEPSYARGMRRFHTGFLAVFSFSLLVAGAAHAQDAKEDATTDHSRVVGHIGVGYFGQIPMPLGSGAGGGVPAPLVAAIPLELVGVRYWFNDGVGLDVALGLGIQSGSNTANGTSVDRPSVFGLGFHVGVPIALYSGKHYTFVIIPQVRFGHESETVKPPVGSPAGTPDTSHTGNHFQIGAAAGGIFHFGFLGIPQLTLDATVGLYADVTGGSTKFPAGAGGGTNDTSFSQLALATSVAHQPWNIFFTNVAAIYHF